MDTLLQLIKNNRGKLTHKLTANICHYEKILINHRDKPISLLEIGVQNGGSLENWARYFSNAQLIVGCDINKLCAKLHFDDPRIKVIIANACSDIGLKKIMSASSSFDIIIDDGSHQPKDIIDAFSRYFPLLSNDGIYVVEDLHHSYWAESNGGLTHPYSSISFFKQLIDIINSEHWGIDFQLTSYLRHFSEYYGCTFDNETLKKTNSIEFVNSMCVIRKAAKEHNLLGPHLVSGTVHPVSSAPLAVANTKLHCPEQNNINLIGSGVS